MECESRYDINQSSCKSDKTHTCVAMESEKEGSKKLSYFHNANKASEPNVKNPEWKEEEKEFILYMTFTIR